MFWYILLGISIVGIILGIVLGKVFENFGWIMWIVSGIIFIILVICIPVSIATYNKNIATFKQQKHYIEEVAPTLPQGDNYALTQKRIELNEWLYEMKYSKEHYGIFTLVPDEILELEEIK